MSQTFWDAEPAVEEELESPDAGLMESEEGGDAFEDPIEEDAQFPHEAEAPEPAPAQVIAVSADEFSALEERILRTVHVVKREKAARAEAEEHAARLQAELSQQQPQLDAAQAENKTLRQERDQVRQRVERLLEQLDSLEL